MWYQILSKANMDMGGYVEEKEGEDDVAIERSGLTNE